LDKIATMNTVADMEITERPVLQGHGFVMFRGGDPVANLFRCMDNRHWSVRVAGARFAIDPGRRFLSGKSHDSMTYVEGEQAARVLALATLAVQKRHEALPAIYQTGTRKD